MAIFPGSAIPSAVSDYEIDNSLRTNRADGARLERTPSVAGNRKNWTFSAWVKISEETTTRDLFSCFSGSAYDRIEFEADGKLLWEDYTGSSFVSRLRPSQVFRDPGSWYHILLRYDSPNATSADRVQFWINGERATALDTDTQPSQDAETHLMNTAIATYVAGGASGSYWGGYVAECYFIDGTSLDASSFGELDSTTNQWKPLDSDDVKDAVTFGTNGFYQKYNSTELGASFADSAPHTPHTMTAHNGAVTKTAQKKFGTASYYGSADTMCLTTPASDDWNFGTADFTLELWARFNTLAADMEFFTHRDSYGNGDWALWWDNPSQGLRFEFETSNIAQGSHSGWAVDTWYHIAAVRSSGVLTLYRDGVSIASGACTTDLDCDAQLVVAEETGGSSGNEGFQGYLDEIRISKGIARYVGGFTPATSAFTADQYTKLLLHCDGSNDGTTFTDSADSAPAHTITANGNVTNQRPQHHNVTANGDAHLIGPKVGTSVIAFDGSGATADGYLSIPDSADFNFGTSDFTIEGFMNFNGIFSSHGGGPSVCGQRSSGTSRWSIYQSRSGLSFYSANGGDDTTDMDSSDLVVNKWYHIAFVRNGNVFKWYIDGVGDTSYTDSYTLPDVGAAMYVGYNGDTEYGEFDGYISGFRISDTARYTADFTPPTSVFVNDSDTKLLIQNGTDGSQTFDDLSTSDHTITATGDPRWFAPKVGAGAMVLDGTGDYFSVPDSVDWDFGAGDFTIEFWAKIGASAPDGSMLSHYDVSSQRSWSVVLDATNNELEFVYSTDGSSATTAAFSWSYSEHTWYLVSICRSGADLKAFIDGTQIGSTYDISTSDLHNSTSTLTIGGDVRSGMGYLFKGAIDDLRIVRTALRTSNWTASTSAFTDSINTVLLLNADVNQGTWAEDTSTGLAISTDSRMKFDGGDDSLSVADSSDWEFGSGDFCIEAWVNVSENTSTHTIWSTTNLDNYGGMFCNVGAAAGLYWYIGTGSGHIVLTAPALSAGRWYHVACVRSGTGSNETIIYVDGVSAATGTYTDNSQDAGANGFYVGDWPPNSWDLNGYVDEVRVSNVERYSGTFTPQTRGNPFEADANTLLLIHSDYTGGLGADSSGNYNNFTATNLVATDQMVDSPTNSFCTLNPLDMTWSYPTGQPIGPPTLSEGNLKSTKTSGSSGYEQSRGTIAVDSGKWYFEMLLVNAGSSNHQAFGICTTSTDSLRWWGGAKDTQWTCQNDGTSMNGDGSDSGFLTYAAGDVMSCAFDVDAGKIWWAKNGTWGASGNPATGANARYTNVATSMAADGNPVAPFNVLYSSSASEFFNFGSDSSFAGAKTAQGNQDGNDKGDFYYEPPSGFLALCTDNLSDPEIKLPGENFNTVLYTGTGSDQSITGAGLQPDLVWIKSRNATYNHNLLDSVRGPHSWIGSNSNTGEDTDANAYLSSFDSDGFTLDGGGGSTNNSGTTYVAWNWKSATTFDPATSGTVTTGSGKSNSSAGFSIVKYTGESGSITVGHGLSQAPECIILKNLDGTYMWSGYFEPVGNTKSISLGDGGAAYTEKTWNDTTPSSTVFTLGASTETSSHRFNYTGEDFIAYCFHSVEGYSKVGSYTGNANADGHLYLYWFPPSISHSKKFWSKRQTVGYV